MLMQDVIATLGELLREEQPSVLSDLNLTAMS